MERRRTKQAFAAAAFAVCMYVSGYFNNYVEAQDATVVSEEPAEDTAVTQGEAVRQIADMTESFDSILNGVTGEFIGGHEIDRSFLLWLYAQYGDEVINTLAAHVLDGDMDTEIWHELTGNSIHVLWLNYCKYTGFQSYQLLNVHWQECKSEKETVIRFTGDFSFADGWCTTAYMEQQADGIYSCFSEGLLTRMQETDILLMNNEFAYSSRGEAIPQKDYVFRAKPEYAKLLDVFGADIVSLANNHVYDYGEEALLDTLTCLKEEGIEYVGAGKDKEEAGKIVYYVANGRKIAFVAATEIERTSSYTKEAAETEAGVFKMNDQEKFTRLIETADKNSDYVIAVVHWGTEGALKYDAEQYRMAEQLVFAGADAIIGGHPHRLQGAGFIRNVPVAYSLGNFWFSTGALYTALAQVTIKEDGSLMLSYLPCIQKGLTSDVITEEAELERYYKYLAAISVQVGFDKDGNVYDKTSDKYPAGRIAFDSDTSETDILGARDIEGNVIDIVGNLK